MSCAAIASARQSNRARHIGFALGMLLTGCLCTPLSAAETVLVPFPHDFAESITATSDGALIFSSFTGGPIHPPPPPPQAATQSTKAPPPPPPSAPGG